MFKNANQRQIKVPYKKYFCLLPYGNQKIIVHFNFNENCKMLLTLKLRRILFKNKIYSFNIQLLISMSKKIEFAI